ncbi:EAL domain-containing protein [Pleionea litopenaei]|uniref:EAL domain-containing protein n=1 Tax=Pleionea litopenaei TaxID=3070815 RepID=A0AA51RQG8_9GAMM|nr:EAL domain-containing protein [Pleionea sp. HL-JVS1]WMS85594.1 EAL domain-containing protein [Pleionea sp. HL-JVS1]
MMRLWIFLLCLGILSSFSSSLHATYDYKPLPPTKIQLNDDTLRVQLSDPLPTKKSSLDISPQEAFYSDRYSFEQFSESTGASPNTFWHKLTLAGSFSDNRPHTFVINFDTYYLRHLDVFIFDGEELVGHHSLGLLATKEAQIDYKGVSAPFSIRNGQELTLLIRKQNDGPGVAPITIYSESQFDLNLKRNFLFWGGAIALLIALALYNVFVYSLNPGRTYLWYLVFHTLTFIYFSALHGFGFLIWPIEMQVWLAQNIMPMNVLLIWSAIQFARVFLTTEVHAPQLHRFIIVINIVTPIALILTYWLPEYYTLPLFFVYQVAASIFGLALGASALINGFRPARYFFISWMCVIVGAALGISAHNHWIPVNFFTLHAFFIGAVAELMLFSVAMADRLRYAEKKAISKAYIDPQRKLPNYSFLVNEFAIQLSHLKSQFDNLSLVVVQTVNYRELVALLGPNILEPIYRAHIERLQRFVKSQDWSVYFHQPSGLEEYFITLPGDQLMFLVKTKDQSEEELEGILQKIIQTTLEPITLKNFEVSLETNAGATPIQKGSSSLLENYRKIQIALLNCKKHHSHWNIYTDEQEESLKQQAGLLHDIKYAINQNQFDIMIQPQMDLFTQEVVGGEVLIRWQHPVRGTVPPQEFIELAEQTGLISQITQQVIDIAFHWISLQKAIPNKFLLAINLSAQELYDNELLPFIEQRIQVYNVHPHHIAFEITESSMMRNAEQSLRTIHQLQQYGFSIAIDDFGTGYSSLSYLQKINADKIKIDLSFVKHIHQNKTNQAIIRTISQLAKSINTKTIAEGIESADELVTIKELACDYGQGHFWSEPLAPEKFAQQYFKRESVTQEVDE